jgi:triacylglycerol lipase
MKGRMAIAAVLLAACAARPASALDLASLGIGATTEELMRLEELDRSVRFDPDALIESTWRGSYDRVTVVRLDSVRNRYALFEDDARKRADIAIRGTVNLRNALLDAQFLKHRSDVLGIYLHTGFEKAALALFEDLKPRLRAGYSLRVAGHSLGAAEAIILGMLLEREGYALELAAASAPPKVTDAEGWALFGDLPLVRVVGPYDPIPFLPPRNLVYGKDPYIQGGRLLMILDGKRFTVQEGSFCDDYPDAVRQAVADGRHFDLKDHSLLTYLERLSPKGQDLEYVAPSEWASYATPAER